jgi:peptidoglycan hydrolase CwlO-like protein
MNLDYTSIIVPILAASLGGVIAAILSYSKDLKKEKIRQQEREQDHLKLDLKDLKIQLYQLEKELTEWKDKYYSAIQELITVKSELEETMLRLSFIDKAIEEYHPEG